MSNVCAECGIIQKSGKLSCCARGGSWFGKCGSAGNGDLRHTWSEGIRVCEARQFRDAVGQEGHDSRAKSKAFSDDVILGMQSKAVFVLANKLASTAATTPTIMSGAPPASESANASTITPVRESIAHATGGKITSGAIATASGTIMRTSLTMLAPEATIRTANGTRANPVRSASTGMFRTGASHNAASEAAASVSFSPRECGKVLHVVTHMSAILAVVCWY